MKFKETSLTKTRRDMAELSELLVHHAPNARFQSDKGSPGVRRAFRDLVLCESVQERGEVLTRIMQASPHLVPIFMEYIQREGPWGKTADVKLMLTLRNNDSKPHQVIYDMWWQPGIDDNGDEIEEDGFPIYEKTVVGAGDTIEMSVHWAAIVLRKYCKRAANPTFWPKWDTIGTKDCFEEVGFRCSLPKLDKNTEELEIDRRPAKPKRKARRQQPELGADASM